MNPNAIHLLEQHPHKINWSVLSMNPNAIHLLEKNLDKLDKYAWYGLSKNPNAIHLLAKFDYERMKENMKDFHKELVEYVFNPQRLVRLANYLGNTFDELNELY